MPKTTATVAALAAVLTLGALATAGNQAAFAQVTNININSQSQTANCNPSESGAGNQQVTCTINQEMGNCQVNVGADRGSEASSDFESGDCS
ncbi:MAG: hypothetical protein M3299_01460 [Thermoproteota archaeon]|nr:hypothetical protein [Thermoproteota archaeon]